MNESPRSRPIALEDRGAHEDARLSSPSAGRNREPIRDVLAPLLAHGARVLEIASGTGEHAACLAKARPDLDWIPSELDPASRASIAAWARAEGLTNIRAPLAIDAAESAWGVEDQPLFDALININMIHISPWEACLGLLAGAGRLLRPGGLLFLYGPFSRGGEHTAPSNAAFSENLKARDPNWGVRDLDDVATAGERHGLTLETTVVMPANNLSVVFVWR